MGRGASSQVLAQQSGRRTEVPIGAIQRQVLATVRGLTDKRFDPQIERDPVRGQIDEDDFKDILGEISSPGAPITSRDIGAMIWPVKRPSVIDKALGGLEVRGLVSYSDPKGWEITNDGRTCLDYP